MLRIFRSAFRLATLLWTTAQAASHLAWMTLSGQQVSSLRARAEWLHRWCAIALPRLAVKIQYEGDFPSRGLLVSNHLSYLDIMVLSAIGPCGFVAKKEVSSWPIYGAMARLSGTIFVDRERKHDAARANAELTQALRSGTTMVLFPEGTSSDGSTVLPFRASLFAAAIAAQEPITPAHIRYESKEGDVGQDVCYWGEMTFLPHVLKLLSLKSIHAHVRFGSDTAIFEERKTAAARMQQRVMQLSGSAAGS